MPRVWAGASAFSARFRQKGLARKGAVMAAMGKAEVLQYLDDQEVFYQKVEHEPVFTMEGMEQLNLPFAAEVVKNLFLRDDKKRAYYLVVMPEDKPANLKALRAMLESRPLRFASADDLEAILGLRAGAVSPLGVLNDDERRVQVVLDKELCSYAGLGIHPNDNVACAASRRAGHARRAWHAVSLRAYGATRGVARYGCDGVLRERGAFDEVRYFSLFSAKGRRCGP